MRSQQRLCSINSFRRFDIWSVSLRDPARRAAWVRSRPPGSLGHAWAQHLDDNGLKPFDYGPRRQQLHDGVHVLTGYGTDPLGEAEVQAFLLGARFHPANLVLLLGLLRGVTRQRRQGQLGFSPVSIKAPGASCSPACQWEHPPCAGCRKP